MTDGFRCTVASRDRGDSLAGTASTVRPFLLVEHPGPWGEDVLRDGRLPRHIRKPLRAAAAATGVRVLLIRRFHRSAPRARFRVFAAYADPHRPWLESAVLDAAEDLLTLDLAALAAGRSPGRGEPQEEPVLCVCTHGRHDVCCAERGRPVAAALASAAPYRSWESSHLGGDRFAGNLLVLPQGLYYGGLDADSALAVADATAAGKLHLDRFRGRSGFAMPVQAAEIALRNHLEVTGIGALTLVHSRRDGPLTEAEFAVDGQDAPIAYAVRVRTTWSSERWQLTCKATNTNPIPSHEVLDIAVREAGD